MMWEGESEECGEDDLHQTVDVHNWLFLGEEGKDRDGCVDRVDVELEEDLRLGGGEGG
jgi:hypothetical protein